MALSKEEALEIAELKMKFDEMLRREEERDKRERERDKMTREIYDMLRFTRYLGRAVKWVCLFAFGVYVFVKHGDASSLAKAFGK